MEKNKEIINKKSTNRLSKFEKARIIGLRAQQISLGSPPMIPITGQMDHIQIANMELEQRKIPMKIQRKLPSGEIEEFMLEEMVIDT